MLVTIVLSVQSDRIHRKILREAFALQATIVQKEQARPNHARPVTIAMRLVTLTSQTADYAQRVSIVNYNIDAPH